MNLSDFLVSWGGFFRVLLVVVLVYLLLLLLRMIVLRRANGWQLSMGVKSWVSRLPEIFEPFGIIIVVVDFVMINPLVHGLLAGVLLLLLFPILRNYVNGRFLRLTEELRVGQRIQLAEGEEGTVQRLEKTGLKLQTRNGIRNVSYTRLTREGITILDGMDISGFYEFLMEPTPEKVAVSREVLENKLFKCPYLDWRFLPEITPVPERAEGHYMVRVLMREESHIQHFLHLLSEWGLTARVAT